jgi:hypothetical protein
MSDMHATTKRKAHGNELPPEPPYDLVEDVDTGPAAEESPKKRRRFDLEADELGPDQPVITEPTENFKVDFGAPDKDTWFRIDPRPDRSRALTFVSVTMSKNEKERPTLFYVPRKARKIPEIIDRLRTYVLHIVRDSHGRLSIWPRRAPTNYASGRQDTWGASDAKVAEAAKLGWVRREVDPEAKGAYRVVRRPEGLPPLPLPPWDKDERSFEQLLELAIPDNLIIEDDRHPVIVYLRTGQVVSYKPSGEEAGTVP